MPHVTFVNLLSLKSLESGLIVILMIIAIKVDFGLVMLFGRGVSCWSHTRNCRPVTGCKGRPPSIARSMLRQQ